MKEYVGIYIIILSHLKIELKQENMFKNERGCTNCNNK